MREHALAAPRRVHQLLGAFHEGDAVGNQARTIQGHLRRRGYESEIFAGWIDQRLVRAARPLRDYVDVSAPDTVCLFHFAAGSPAGRLIYHAPDRLVLIYHNITPARFFSGFSPSLARLSHLGRRELAAFASRTELALGVSDLNRAELTAAGFASTGVLPFVFDRDAYRRPPSAVVRRLYGDGRTNILCVGRLAPNKRLEDVLRGFAVYQRFIDRRSRLLLVGEQDSVERYSGALLRLIRELRLERVVLAGHVEHDELLGYYSVADVLLSLSEHEGFGVPLVEAMELGVPVIAYDAGAVAETLQGGGVLLKGKHPELVAELVHSLASDPDLRRAVLATQEKALAKLRATDFAALLMDRLAPVLEAPGA